jgi:hypothetical protein
VAQVDFYAGTTLLGTATAPPFEYTWSDVAAGSYGLTARATDNQSGTATSSPVTVTVNGSLPPPWSSQDVGAVGLAGSATYSAGTFTLNGSGAGIGGTSDQFHFVHQTLTGDGQIVARITGVQNVNSFSKGGIMIRESLAANSTNAAMLITGGNRLHFQRRLTTGATTGYSSGSQTTPHWVKLVRTGDTFTASRSTNGVSWTVSGSYVIPMSPDVFVGLVMSSNNNAILGTATLDNVTVTPGN